MTGFFCWCKFLRFVSKIGTCNFFDPIFCNFTPWRSDFYSLDDMKKLHQSITQAEPLVPCSYEQKLIGSGMTKAVGLNSS